MIVKFKDKEYNVVSNWSEVTLEQSKKLEKIKYDKKIEWGEYETTVSIVSILSNIPEEELLSLPYTQYKKMEQIVNSINNDIKDRELVYKFELDGIEYGLSYDMNNYSTAEFFDLFEMTKSVNKAEENIDIIMSILYRPIINKIDDTKLGYEIEEYDILKCKQRINIFKKAPVHIATSSIVFFSIFATELLDTFQLYSPEKLQADQN